MSTAIVPITWSVDAPADTYEICRPTEETPTCDPPPALTASGDVYRYSVKAIAGFTSALDEMAGAAREAAVAVGRLGGELRRARCDRERLRRLRRHRQAHRIRRSKGR